MSQAFAEDVCRGVYRKAKSFFRDYEGHPKYTGFSILQGPPIFQPPIVLIGLQPGKIEEGEELLAQELEERWPLENINATRDYKFTKELRRMFGESRLESCAGINAIFARSKDVPTYTSEFSTADRKRIEGFCIPQVREIIRAFDPERLVFVGFSTQELFERKKMPIDSADQDGLPLTLVGQIEGRPAFVMRHPSAHFVCRRADLDQIRDRVALWLAQ